MIPVTIMESDGIRDYIFEDNTPFIVPDVINEIWLSAFLNENLIACFRLHSLSSVSCQYHPMVLPLYRAAYSHEVVMASYSWCIDMYTHIQQYVSLIPKCHRHIILFARQCGLKHIGSLPRSYVRHGNIVDTEIYSITPDEIKKRRKRWDS